ncbi:MAG: single-stranded-DNA-specific exonuclease RecJ [Gammaproteobacteria bacterium]|nr:single-stranded-DNA-specific exonuclease RecJ [Gammaproteobacteria bacterium]
MKRREALCQFGHSQANSGQERRDKQDVEIDPLLQRVYQNRNISDPDDVTYSLSKLYPPKLLKGIDEATCLLVEAIKSDASIVIVGDYDTDGATATTLAMLGLSALGSNQVQYLVPNRFEFGYGLSEKIANLALQLEPNLLITVDNGISSIDGVALLKEKGVKTIITDHHLAGKQLPEADAIVNPNQPLCEFPSKALAGVGVMFYLLLSVRTKLRKEGWFFDKRIAEPNLADYLDLVALGTVADMVPLDANNRVLVAQGIARIRAGKCRFGIIALLEVANRNYRNLSSSDFGFVIGPRLNAAGRLDDISTGIDCLLASSHQEARDYAQVLNEINIERRRIEKVMQEQAFEIVRTLQIGSETLEADVDRTAGYCLYDPTWHQGVTGLVASRVKDQTSQPTIAFAPTEGGLLTGSARTIAGLHIRDLIEAIAEQSPNLVVKFGGHAMAAGLTIEEANLNEFKRQFYGAVVEGFSSVELDFSVKSDGEISASELSLDYADLLKNAAPWGQGFPAPVFDGVFKVLEQRVVGGQHIKFVVKGKDGGIYDAIAFKSVELGNEPGKFDFLNMAYQLDVNEFRGHRSLQLIIESFEPTASVN